MRAGKLDRTIVLRRTVETVDAYGTTTEAETDVATLRAQLVQASTQEFLRAFGASADVATIFRTRWLDGVTTKDRVLYEGRTHDIVELKEIGRRRGLEIRTVARDA